MIFLKMFQYLISHFNFLVSSLKNVEFFNQTIKNFLLKFVKNIFNRALSSFTNITGTVSFLLYDLKWYMFYILASYFRGGFRVLVRGVRVGEPKFFGNILKWAGVPIFIGGCQPLIYKHINRGLTYDLLIVIYHLLKIFTP